MNIVPDSRYGGETAEEEMADIGDGWIDVQLRWIIGKWSLANNVSTKTVDIYLVATEMIRGVDEVEAEMEQVTSKDGARFHD